jgi:hypothetical protein
MDVRELPLGKKKKSKLNEILKRNEGRTEMLG